jgi:hypothetical protein
MSLIDESAGSRRESGYRRAHAALGVILDRLERQAEGSPGPTHRRGAQHGNIRLNAGKAISITQSIPGRLQNGPSTVSISSSSAARRWRSSASRAPAEV